MALWLNRAGRHGEYEQRFIDDNRIYLTWDELNQDVSIPKTKQELGKLLHEVYPNAPKGRVSQNTGQIWSFVKRMKPGGA